MQESFEKSSDLAHFKILWLDIKYNLAWMWQVTVWSWKLKGSYIVENVLKKYCHFVENLPLFHYIHYEIAIIRILIC